VDREHGIIRLQGKFTKNGEPRTLPLVGELAEIIDRRWQAREIRVPGQPPQLATLVFHHRPAHRPLDCVGQPIGNIRKEWKKATKAAGVPGLRFHDFRRSAVRNMDNAAVPQMVARSITGHKTASTWERYRITSTTEQREGLGRTLAAGRTRQGRVTPLRRKG
jgi:integrase